MISSFIFSDAPTKEGYLNILDVAKFSQLRYFRSMQFLQLLVFWVFLILFLPGYALYNGNPALPKIPEEGFFISKEAVLSLRAGYEGDLVFDRNMAPHIHKFKIFENFGVVAACFEERVDLYAGAGSYYAEIRQSHWQKPSNSRRVMG